MSQKRSHIPLAVEGKEANAESAIIQKSTVADVKVKEATNVKKSDAKEPTKETPKNKVAANTPTTETKEPSKEPKSKESKSSTPEKKQASDTKAKGEKKQNGDLSNGKEDQTKTNGTANKEVIDTVPPLVLEDDEISVVVIDQENDEMFPELKYDETSDAEGNFESSTPDYTSSGRSLTRRSQVKAARTPETPKPVGNGKATSSTNQASNQTEESQQQIAVESASTETVNSQPVVKLTAMKLRNSPVPQLEEPAKEGKDVTEEQKNDQANKADVSHGKSDTNFSKSRIKVSPYRRSMRKAEATATGSSTSLTESVEASSSQMDDRPSTSDDSLASPEQNNMDFRNIKGRRSYKQLREISLRNLAAQRQKREAATSHQDMEVSNGDSINATTGSDIASVSTLENSAPGALKGRPTPIGTVIGRKRRSTPSPERSDRDSSQSPKRARFFDRVGERMTAGVTPIRRFLSRSYTSTPIQVSLPDEHRDVADTEYMSIVPPSEDVPSTDEDIADKVPEVIAENLVPAIAVQPNRRCSIM